MKTKLFLIFFLLSTSLLFANQKAKQKNNNGYSPAPGVIASNEVDYGVMLTLRGKTSISRFTDNSKNVTCYVSHKHKTDEILSISCVPLKK